MKRRSAILITTFLLIAACPVKSKAQSILDDVRILSSVQYAGRKTGTEGNRKAADYIIKRLENLGLKSYGNSFRQSFSFRNDGKKIQGTNLIAYIPGKTSKAIVLSAHYDHLGIIDKQVYPGADDNASGVAGLLAIAAYFKQHPPEHTMIFAFFDAEEIGLRGSKAFVASPPVPLSTIRLNINLDMISRNDQQELYVSGTYFYPRLSNYLVTTVPGIKLLSGHDRPSDDPQDNWTFQGDHGSFHNKKIPFLYFGVEDHVDYHRPTDTFRNINKVFFQNAVKAILEVTINFDRGITLQKRFNNRKIMS